MQDVWDSSEPVVGASLLAMSLRDAAGRQASSVIVDDHRERARSYSGLCC